MNAITWTPNNECKISGEEIHAFLQRIGKISGELNKRHIAGDRRALFSTVKLNLVELAIVEIACSGLLDELEDVEMQSYPDIESQRVIAFDIQPEYIDIKYNNFEVRRYTVESVGFANLDTMKKLAQHGYGLMTFIAKNVLDKFTQKWTIEEYETFLKGT